MSLQGALALSPTRTRAGRLFMGQGGARGTSTVGPAGRDLVGHSRVHDVTGCGLHEAMLWKRVSVRLG